MSNVIRVHLFQARATIAILNQETSHAAASYYPSKRNQLSTSTGPEEILT